MYGLMCSFYLRPFVFKNPLSVTPHNANVNLAPVCVRLRRIRVKVVLIFNGSGTLSVVQKA